MRRVFWVDEGKVQVCWGKSRSDEPQVMDLAECAGIIFGPVTSTFAAAVPGVSGKRARRRALAEARYRYGGKSTRTTSYSVGLAPLREEAARIATRVGGRLSDFLFDYFVSFFDQALPVRAKRTMHMHPSWQGPTLTQDRCICLPGQGRRAYAPILGSGWAWPESVHVHSSFSSTCKGDVPDLTPVPPAAPARRPLPQGQRE
ncbi:unnamed protein product [Prorocentrum cordatum]|uniref:Uncharacterized protein n=1 Tax=Prorocentrum cordatum TaxID=2364126 RepID=A0ABN9XGI7_9DINO|nr:unnamed protein product [Polarella glacialis]